MDRGIVDLASDPSPSGKGGKRAAKRKRPLSVGSRSSDGEDDDVVVVSSKKTRRQLRPRADSDPSPHNERKHQSHHYPFQSASAIPPSLYYSANPVLDEEIDEAEADGDLARALTASKAAADSELRHAQDEEFQMSLAMDRAKQTHIRETKLAQEQAAKAIMEQKAAKARNLALKRQAIESKLAALPQDTATLRIRLEVPGNRFDASFDPQQTLGTLMDWVQLKDERCLRATIFEIDLSSSRIRSDAPASIMKQSLASLGLARTCIRTRVVLSDDDDEDEDDEI
mmetsp:Transcript_18086/g.33410  ORF Transcript_18086/g.33410 Transcript_18086/m.33410 type:complete len:284 (+) Transcript_18086:372-1223(+)